MSISAWSRHPRRWIFVVSPIFALLLVYYLLQGSLNTSVQSIPIDQKEIPSPFPTPSNYEVVEPENVDTSIPNCRHIRGMEDVLVVMKTGVTEVLEKVPVHINTTLSCVPHYVIFSDYEEDVAGVRTHDVLRSVSNETKHSNSDFSIYNRLNAKGRNGLVSDDWHDEANGPFGKPGNPGWKLDKWKFVPMMDEALQAYDAKWYVFMEADSYLVWPNLVSWLARLDHTKPYYMGAPMQIGSTLFAYGGSGIIMSKPALQKVSKYRSEHPKELDKFTTDSWAGDCILGKVLQDVNVPLTWAWPMLQTDRVWEMDHFSEGYGKKPWCYPVVSYHHMKPDDIEAMWAFDQEWFRDGRNSLLLHGDVFKRLILNDTFNEHDNWDNLSKEDATEQHKDLEFKTADDCARYCIKNSNCLQFSFENGKCMTSQTAIRGVSRSTVRSGWMTKRIQTVLRNMNSCSQVEYVS